MVTLRFSSWCFPCCSDHLSMVIISLPVPQDHFFLISDQILFFFLLTRLFKFYLTNSRRPCHLEAYLRLKAAENVLPYSELILLLLLLSDSHIAGESSQSLIETDTRTLISNKASSFFWTMWQKQSLQRISRLCTRSGGAQWTAHNKNIKVTWFFACSSFFILRRLRIEQKKLFTINYLLYTLKTTPLF